MRVLTFACLMFITSMAQTDTNEVGVGFDIGEKLIEGGTEWAKEKFGGPSEPGHWEDNVPKPSGPNDIVVRKVCVKYECRGTLFNPIPIGQVWEPKGQASAKGCCKFWGSACQWCSNPLSVPDEQEMPKCYFMQGTGNGNCDSTLGAWDEDTWGRDNENSWNSYSQCMGRKSGQDSHCGTDSKWCFTHGGPEDCGGPETRVCWVDACHSTPSNPIPNGQIWERVVASYTDKGCCGRSPHKCDLCRGRMGLKTGDQIYLKSKNTGKHIDVDNDVVKARWDHLGDWQRFTIEKDKDGNIENGNQMYLRAHTGKYLDIENQVVQARYYDRGNWQRMIIFSEAGHGPIYKGSAIYLQAQTGMLVDVDGEEVRARSMDMSDLQLLMVEQDDYISYSQEISDWQYEKRKKVCYKDQCIGDGHPIKKGEQWIRIGQASDRGCCSGWKGMCDWCVPPAELEESVADTALTQSSLETFGPEESVADDALAQSSLETSGPEESVADILGDTLDKVGDSLVEGGTEWAKEKFGGPSEPGHWEDNVPKPSGPNDIVVRKVCVKYECRGTLFNPIPIGQVWEPKGQASAKGCCKFWGSACQWCSNPLSVPEEQEMPKCYFMQGTGNGNCDSTLGAWDEDTWGRDNENSWNS